MHLFPERAPRWSGRFYPADPERLRADIARMTPAVASRPAVAAMLPHAGYQYSGAVAAETLAGIDLPETVLLIGPKHTPYGAPIAINRAGAWRTPLGPVAIDPDVAEAVAAVIPEAVDDDLAFRDEHSLEVLVPLLQVRRPDVRIVPLLIGHPLSGTACAQLGGRLAAVLGDVLLVASSDMHHQGLDDLPAGQTTAAVVRDRTARALADVDAEDPVGLVERCRAERISMCGVRPAAIAMGAAAARGAHPTRVAVTDSQAVAGGDGRWVVGYAGYRWT